MTSSNLCIVLLFCEMPLPSRRLRLHTLTFSPQLAPCDCERSDGRKKNLSGMINGLAVIDTLRGKPNKTKQTNEKKKKKEKTMKVQKSTRGGGLIGGERFFLFFHVRICCCCCCSEMTARHLFVIHFILLVLFDRENGDGTEK